MTYVFAAIFACLVYCLLNSNLFRSREDKLEALQARVDQAERSLLKSLEFRPNHDVKVRYECGRKNYVRLTERFKHQGSQYGQ
jgi:hypothetical protein